VTERTHYRTCNLCEAMCGLEIKLKDEQIVSIRGDVDDPFSRGHICPKALALQDIYHDEDRLKHPVRRTADGWERISWEEAYDEVVTRLKSIQQKYGKDSVGIYQGNPNVHNVGSLLFGPPFVRTLRTRNRYSATSADQLPHHFAAYFMFGHQLLLPIPDIDRTDYLLILGANPLVSNGSIMTAAGVEDRLKRVQERGGRFVVIDPRRTETAVKADAHYFIRPGSDAFFLLGLLNVIYAENLADPDRLSEFTDGLDVVPTLAAEFSPEMVSGKCGIEPAVIRQIARDFATADSAVCYGRFGVSTQEFGGLTQYLVNVLNIVTGNLDRPGGAMFTQPAIDVVAITGLTGGSGRYGRWTSRVRKRPEFSGELPVAVLAEEILTPGEGQIKAMVTTAGNPVLSAPNGAQLDEALAQLEFMVSIDIYINETTRHAHIILPPATGLETEHYDLAFHALAVRNTVKYSPALFPPADGAKHDWEIFRDLRVQMVGNGPVSRLKKDIFYRFTPRKIIDLGLRFGPYGAWNRRRVGEMGLSLRKVENEVHGIDLGALRPCLPGRLFTPSNRIQLVPEILVKDIDRLKSTSENRRSENGELLLIGRRQLRSNNSWMHNTQRLVKGKERCTLLMHPEDALVRGITQDSQVEVESRTGSLKIPVEISEEMMPGIVSIPHGWGHHRPGIQLKIAQQHPGVSVNDVTDDVVLDELSGNAAFSGVQVSIRPCDDS